MFTNFVPFVAENPFPKKESFRLPTVPPSTNVRGKSRDPYYVVRDTLDSIDYNMTDHGTHLSWLLTDRMVSSKYC